jgi:hypothetical protein
MADIVKKIAQLHKERESGDDGPAEGHPSKASGIMNLGTIGNPHLKMAPDGSLSGFQEISLDSSPASGDKKLETMFGGMREFTLDALESMAEASPGAPASGRALDGEIHELDLDALAARTVPSGPPPSSQGTLEADRRHFIRLIGEMLFEGRYEAAVNAILEMRKVIGGEGGR